MYKYISKINILLFSMVLFAQPVTAQSVVGTWDGTFESYVNYNCEGNPFVSGLLAAVLTDTDITATMTTSYTFDGLCGMLGGTVDENNLCNGMTQDELFELYCPALGGTYDGTTCDAVTGVTNGPYTLNGDQMCITTVNPETGLEETDCGTVAYTDNGFSLTMQEYADPNDPDDNDHCLLWTFGTPTDDNDNVAFQPTTKEELQTAVALWVSDNTTALSTYGEINSWDVSLITDMMDLFNNLTTFDSDISNWDVSNVTTMRHMFQGAQSFNQDLSSWNVSNVNDMIGMFRNAHNFDGNIGSWDVSSLTTSTHMFYDAFNFNSDLSNWDVSNVTNMFAMFIRAQDFNADISNWNVSNVTDMAYMFYQSIDFNRDLSGWDVSNVTNMGFMFLGAQIFNQDLSSWNVTNVTQMDGIFDNTVLSDENKCAIHTSWSSNDAWPYEEWSSICDSFYAFANKNELITALDLWESDNATALSTYGEINTWNVSAITNFADLFRDRSTFNGNISSWDVSNVTTMRYSFAGASSFNQDLSNWDVSSVTTMHMMFPGCGSFTSDLSDWDVSNVTDMHRMFNGVTNFTSDLSDWDVSNVTDMASLFNGPVNFTSDLSGWDVSSVTNLGGMFVNCGSFESDLSGWDVSNATSIGDMFQNASSFNSDLSSWNVSNVTNMWGTFQNASSFESDLSDWDVANVEYFNGMFNNTNLTDDQKCAIHTSWSANSNWNYDWSDLCTNTTVFQPATKDELQVAVDLWVSDNATALETYGEINTWDVSLITDMTQLFNDKTDFNESISNWDVSNVTTFFETFRDAENFNQDLSAWDLSSATILTRTFFNATSFNSDISNWNVTSNVTHLTDMFSFASSFNQDLSSWDVSGVTNFYLPFRETLALSDENKCAIHTSWSVQNDLWPYDWSDLCALVSGCTDVYAENYDENATEDDGSCYGYPSNGDYSLSFGIGKSVVLGDLLDQTAYTKTAWIKKEDGSGFNNIFSGYSHHAFGAPESQEYRLAGGHNNVWSSVTSPEPLVYGEWTFVALTYDPDVDSGTLKLYRDGQMVASSINIPLQNDDNNCYIGRFQNGNGNEFHGNIDAVTLWHRALDESEILELMNYSDNVSTDQLVGSWMFDMGEGDIAYDHSGNGNHGTILSPDWSEDHHVPPTISVAPQSLSENLLAGESSVQNFTITNSGDSDLDWSSYLADMSRTQVNHNSAIAEAIDNINERAVAPSANSVPSAIGHNLDEASSTSKEAAGTVYAQRNDRSMDIFVIYCDVEEWGLDVVNKLAETGQFNSISHVDARSVTPTLDEMLLFESILVYSDYAFYDPVLMGNNLADYIDAGGGVVVSMFALNATWSMSGRFIEDGYNLMSHDDGINYDNDGISVVINEEGHSIFNGVDVDGLQNCGACYNPQNTNFTEGAVRVADWSNGSPLAVVKDVDGFRQVNLGLFPNTTDVLTWGWSTESDIMQLLANSITWVSGQSIDDGPLWLNMEPLSGSVAPGESHDVAVSFYSEELLPGNYGMEIQIASNDPMQPELIVPVDLTVYPSVTYDPTFTYLGSFGDNLYYLSEYQSTWEDANSYLNDNFIDAHLVAITSEEENAFLANAHPSGQAWIGLTDKDSEGVWQWVTGEDYVFSNWSANEPNGSGNYALTNWGQAGFWDDQPNTSKFFLVEVTTYENVPPSEFSLLAPTDDSYFDLTDNDDLNVTLRWQDSEDQDNDVNYFVELHGTTVVGGDTLRWHNSMSDLTNQDAPMVNTSFENPDETGYLAGWTSWPEGFQNINHQTYDSHMISMSGSNDSEHPDNYLMQVLDADLFEEFKTYRLSAMFMSEDGLLGDISDNAVLYVKAFSENGGQGLIFEKYGHLDGDDFMAGEWYEDELYFFVNSDAVELHIGAYYMNAGEPSETATVLIDNFSLTAPYSSNTLSLSKQFFEDQISHLVTLPNVVESLQYSWSVIASDGTVDGKTPSSNTLRFGVVNYRTEDARDYHVSVEGSDVNGDGTPEAPLRNIQTALNLSADGSSVHVSAGTYFENLSITGKSVSIYGVLNGEDIVVIVDGQQLGPVLSLQNINEAEFHNLLIANGRASSHASGGGMRLVNVNDTDFDNILVVDNHDHNHEENNFGKAGGILIAGGSPRFHRLRVFYNHGGGVRVGGGQPEFYESQFTSTFNGRALEVYDTGIIMDEGCYVADNPSGGIWYEGVGFNPSSIKNTVFHNNGSPESNNGAFHFMNAGGQLIMDRVVFHMNHRNGDGADFFSAGNSFNDGEYVGNHITMSNAIFYNEESNQKSLELVQNGNQSTFTLTNATFSGLDELIFPDNYSVSLDRVHLGVNPLFCGPEGGNFNVAENTPLLNHFENGELPGVVESTGCDAIALPSIFVTDFPDTLYVDEDDSITFAVELEPFLGNLQVLTVNIDGDIEVHVEWVDTENSEELQSWLVTLTPESNHWGNRSLTLVAEDQVYGTLTELDLELYINPINDGPEFGLFDNPEFDEDTSFEVELGFDDVDHYEGELTLEAHILEIDGGETTNATSYFENENYTPLGEFNGHHYFVSTYESLWTDANAMLDEIDGAHLATMNSAEENDFVSSAMNLTAWIGLNDLETEGVWQWVTGEEVSYTNWNGGEPNNAGNEDIVEMFTNGKWNDHQTNQRRVFVVEVDGGPMAVNLEGAQLTLTPATNWNGEFTLQLIVTDPELASDTITTQGIVHPVNDPPVLVSIQNQYMNEDETLSLAIPSNDVDGDVLEVQAHLTNDAPVDLYVFADGDSLMIVPHPNWSGNAQIHVSVFDGEYSDSKDFELVVNPVDDDPFVVGYMNDVYLYEDFQEPWEANLNELFEDIDGPLDFSVEFESEIIGHELHEGVLHLFPLEDSNGVTEMVVTAFNPVRTSVSDTVMVTVFAVNDAPELGELAMVNGLEDELIQLWSMSDLQEQGILVDVDNDLNDLNFDIHMNHDHFMLDWDFDAYDPIVLLPHQDFYGETMLTLCVYDGEYEACSDFEVVVAPVNDAPFFTGEMSHPVGKGLDFAIEVHFEDVDNDYEDLTLQISDGPEWVSVEGNHLVGMPSELGHYPVVLALNDLNDYASDTLHLHVENFVPELTSISDVPDDQGGRVYVSFNSSFFDNGETNGQSYSLFRHDTFENDSSGWVALTSIDAVGDSEYTFEASTLRDSTSENNGMTLFKVVGSMTGGIFHSNEHEGYSIDNIAPGVPGGLLATAVEDGIELVWNVSLDDDFQYFILERSLEESFLSSVTFELIDTIYVDMDYEMNQTYFYRLAAVDYAGNHSEFSDVVQAALLSLDENLIPAEFALHQNYPNPFNPVTQIKYDLAEDGLVTINIFDILGRNIRTLLNVDQSAGYHSIRWDATNDHGEAVSAGMYFYLIQAGEFKQTRKMVLLK